MALAAKGLVGLVALLHLVFLVLESFLWQTELGRRVFKQSAEQAAATAVLARNQGLYNGFLAAGLVWSLTPACGDPLGVQTFFLACVVVAGVVGALTASPSIILVQGLPGLLALIAARLS